MRVLTGIDILGIQRYVFASNRLRDALAASWMVDHVTKREADSLLQWGMTDDRVLLAAGGNAILEFDDVDDAKRWTARYTRWLHDVAPGLDVVVAHRPYAGRSLAWGLKALAIDLARAKLERRPGAPQLGLGVTAACAVTGLPTTSLESHDAISRHIETLRQNTIKDRAKERWNGYLPERLDHAPGWTPAFPLEFDHMGRSHGETSLVGVVHVDGNGVGKAIQGWLDRCLEEKTSDDEVRRQYRQWSRAIDELAEQVLQAVIGRVASRIFEEKNDRGEKRCVVRGTPHDLGFALKTDGSAVCLPLRPILLGGDDLTFVCDGRIALDLAAAALREFAKHPIPHLGSNGEDATLTACAGVALVKAHAPFHRGYDLAERLCTSAKRARREENERTDAETGCWLDWHVGSTRPAEPIEDVRKREYQDRKLTMRPYPLMQIDGRKQSWDWMDLDLLGPGRAPDAVKQGFRGAPCWAESRSRVKRLGALVPEGQDAIKRQVEAWQAIEDDVQLPAGLPAGGFHESQTPLLDAIELFDLHLRLERDMRVSSDSVKKETADE